MAISTNSIIHYTKDYKSLAGIIMEGFRIKYCYEALHTSKNIPRGAAHPMVSFCDIPLSLSHQHFGLYGYYGIGLKKNWAKTNNINPVLYVEKESDVGNLLYNLLVQKDELSGPHKETIIDFLFQTKCFTKNYSGPLKRGDINKEDYKFYDEREWRYIPKKDQIGNRSISIPGSLYNKDKVTYNSRISTYRLEFAIDDISYIIVKNTSEIPKIIKLLREHFYSSSASAKEIDILLSKVCSTEQIICDY
jgi:hypothetical protein